VKYADVTGDGKLDALVQVTCRASTSSISDQIEVFDGASSATEPRLLGVLLSVDRAVTKHRISDVATTGTVVTVNFASWDNLQTPLCCLDTAASQSFDWKGSSFTARQLKRTPLT